MSWIQENKVPAAILGLTGAGVVGLGVVLFNAWSAASTSQEEFDRVNTSLANLKSANLAPTPENLAQKQALVQDYEKAVGQLSLVLYKLQPDDKPTTNAEFQAKLKTKVADIKKEGSGRLPAEFNLGFDQYTSELPKNDQVAAELSTYLDSVDTIVRLALKSGIRSLDVLDRSLLASEKGESTKPQPAASKSKAKGQPGRPAAPAPVSITERRQVRLTIRTDQSGLQALLSGLTSPSDMPFFTVARLVRIENEVQVGPMRTNLTAAPAEGEGAAPQPVDPNAPAKPATLGVQAASPDSKVVLGRETLRAYIEIDLVKFLNPQTAAAAGR
ncbi:MAG: Amuc_1100 family pilus-like protein [Verrucomicrobiota bacterium]